MAQALRRHWPRPQRGPALAELHGRGGLYNARALVRARGCLRRVGRVQAEGVLSLFGDPGDPGPGTGGLRAAKKTRFLYLWLSQAEKVNSKQKLWLSQIDKLNSKHPPQREIIAF